jgi:hypothetical protein
MFCLRLRIVNGELRTAESGTIGKTAAGVIPRVEHLTMAWGFAWPLFPQTTALPLPRFWNRFPYTPCPEEIILKASHTPLFGDQFPALDIIKLQIYI